jgi:hypothetical protein
MQVVFLTILYLPALYVEDLLDAAENVGCRSLPCSGTSSVLAMAGMGLGLNGVYEFFERSVGIGKGEKGEEDAKSNP